VIGELLRLPAHPRAVVLGLVGVIGELPEIIRARRGMENGVRVLQSMLVGEA
jgi:hypothetical protein